MRWKPRSKVLNCKGECVEPFSKPKLLQEDRGSVRWRTLFEQVLRPEEILLYRQACYRISANGEPEFLYYELFARIQDPQEGIL